MSWHGWFFTADGGNRPHFPDGVVPQKASYVASLTLLGTMAGHAHLKVGGFARPDGRLGDVAGRYHFHDIVKYGGEWYVFTTGTANHEHEVPDAPSWWLVCALIRDEDVAACAADPQMFPIGQIMDGAISTETWDADELALWRARILAGLYLNMPAVINNDDRLVHYIKDVCGLDGSEIGYRCPGGDEG